jgi:Glutaredoxin-like domain (DUF836)
VPTLTLLSRPDCGLCDEFQLALAALERQHPLPPLQVVDVDMDPKLARRYGHDIPVLLLDDVKVCMHRLDSGELLRLLRPR